MRIALAVAVLAIGLSGCAAPGIIGARTGTVTGHVLVRVCGGPMPAEGLPSRACTPHPLPATVSFQATSGGQAITATTDASGAYSVALPAGAYSARVNQPAATARTVVVTAGQVSRLDFMIDVELM